MHSKRACSGGSIDNYFMAKSTQSKRALDLRPTVFWIPQSFQCKRVTGQKEPCKLLGKLCDVHLQHSGSVWSANSFVSNPLFHLVPACCEADMALESYQSGFTYAWPHAHKIFQEISYIRDTEISEVWKTQEEQCPLPRADSLWHISDLLPTQVY